MIAIRRRVDGAGAFAVTPTRSVPGIPRILVVAAGWSWRLLLLGVVAYLVVRVLALLWLVVVPVLAALLLTALLRPLTVLLHRRLPGPASAVVTLLTALMSLAGVGSVIGLRFAQQLPSLLEQVVGTIRRLRATLGSLGLGQSQLNQLQDAAIARVQIHRTDLVTYLTTGIAYAAEFLTLAVLTLFVTFFLLYDGSRVWRWLLTPLRPRFADRADRAGQAAWATLTGYVHGTAVIATIHGVVIGLVVFLLGVPLAIPLAVLVFLGSFVPIVGTLLAGGLAVLVTFGTQGWPAALILLGVLLAEDQLEAHLLQPLIVGRYVGLHPLAIGLALATGTVLGGVIGAILAVPVAAIIHRTAPALLGDRGDARIPRDVAPTVRAQPSGRSDHGGDMTIEGHNGCTGEV